MKYQSRILAVALFTMASVVILFAFSAIAADPQAAAKPPVLAGEPPPTKFVALDTSHLMGSPDRHAVFGVEKAFPHLTFKRPLEFTHAGDGSGRVFVIEQDGRILVFANRHDVKEAKVFLDIRDKVRREHNEEGLLGLAFHPKFRDNGEFFVFHSVTPKGSVVSRFKVSNDADRADPASQEILLQFAKPYGNHNGGSMKFGPDGFLYIGLGDGGAGNDPQENGQNLQTLLGKLLRIDVDRKDEGLSYAIPKDNPFTGQARVRGEIWAYGLRNIWRIAFDRESGTLWAADVGQDHHEEVNIIVRGGNYGWNFREGKHPRDEKNPRTAVGDFIDPVLDYPRIEGKSITGGLVYRGKRLPQLAGAYLYADYISGNMWALRTDGKIVKSNDKIARTSLLISAFGEDEEGEVYFTAFDGAIYRFRDVPQPAASMAFPRTLTQTKLFASVPDHKPGQAMIPYSVNVPLWSDGAEKDRFIVLPAGATVEWKDKESWEFPVGTVIVKTFLLQTDEQNPKELRRLETRLWLHNPRGWEGFTYLWNEEQTEAHLMGDWPVTQQFDVKTPTGKVKQTWYFPSRSDCQACHTHNAGFVLGLNTRQLNRPYNFQENADTPNHTPNQIDMLRALGVFKNDVVKPSSELESFPNWKSKAGDITGHNAGDITILARAYLDANCSMCHSPGGPGNAQGAAMDMRFHQPLEQAFPAKKDVKAGDPRSWNVLHRMGTRDTKAPRQQMPPLATFRVDDQAVHVIQKWLDQLEKK